jgi:hypothetical protein
MINKYIIDTMMQHTFNHSLKQQPKLGTLAYWSMFASLNSDRTPEITGVREDTV